MPWLKKVPLLKKIFEFGYTMLLIIILSAISGLILAFPVMWLWNFVFQRMNEALHINVFQAWALNVLTGILFGYKNTSSKNDR